jgi:hypothetical protein
LLKIAAAKEKYEEEERKKHPQIFFQVQATVT